ncbi:hypothetical protein [Thiothrix fructosivorans]|uniref:Uncharacterized protein n=1 Tax=Thiothrix fructosivorans TaxID=111770 RepID=A0A8B0SIA4_9GAMM|nr:hypothetical protein [Thiothrix fructosivorans]QTX10655.1 hypothetical protein J1836_019155 [Thiothrix fructosivorans]
MNQQTANRIKTNGKAADLRNQPLATKKNFLHQYELALKTLDKGTRK